MTNEKRSDRSPASGRSGGCLCGAVRYRVSADALATTLCHCSMCRRAAGAPVTAWAMFPEAAFALERGELTLYASSPGVERGFCARCGTTLSFAASFLPGLIDLTIASFDEPEQLPPRLHMWEKERLAWLRFADDLPRHAELPPFSGDAQ